MAKKLIWATKPNRPLSSDDARGECPDDIGLIHDDSGIVVIVDESGSLPGERCGEESKADDSQHNHQKAPACD